MACWNGLRGMHEEAVQVNIESQNNALHLAGCVMVNGVAAPPEGELEGSGGGRRHDR